MTDDHNASGDPLAESPSLTDPAARAAAAALPNHERQRIVQSMLVSHPAFEAATREIADQHRPVRGGTKGVGQIGGIVGPSRAGKSTAIRNYAFGQGQVPQVNADGDKVSAPRIAYVNAQKGWTALDLGVALALQVTGAHLKRKAAAVLSTIIVEEVKHCGIEMVVIDDAQWLVASRFHATVDQTIGLVIALAETNSCNVLLAGLPPIRRAIQQVDSAYRRGSFPHAAVEPYDWMDPAGREAFCLMLDDIDDRLPFQKPSDIADPGDTAAHLYRLSGGLIGLAMNIIRPAAFLAINDGAERISRKHLQQAAEKRRRINDRYAPFGRRLSDEEAAAGADLVVEPDDDDPPPAPTLYKKRKRRSGIE